MVGRTSVLENCVLVVLGMRGGEVPAVKIEVVFLFAVIRQGLARYLSSGDTSTVGEYCKKKRIHAGTFLKHIKNLLSAFIHKRNRSHLDADHFGRDSSVSWSRHGQRGAGASGDLQEFTAIYVQSQSSAPYDLACAVAMLENWRAYTSG